MDFNQKASSTNDFTNGRDLEVEKVAKSLTEGAKNPPSHCAEFAQCSRVTQLFFKTLHELTPS